MNLTEEFLTLVTQSGNPVSIKSSMVQHYFLYFDGAPLGKNKQILEFNLLHWKER